MAHSVGPRTSIQPGTWSVGAQSWTQGPAIAGEPAVRWPGSPSRRVCVLTKQSADAGQSRRLSVPPRCPALAGTYGEGGNEGQTEPSGDNSPPIMSRLFLNARL